MGRRPPALVRQQETICRSHQPDLHRIPGLSPAVNAVITIAEHGPLVPGQVADAFRTWERIARQGGVYRSASNPCGYPECCGSGPRGQLDQIYLSRTLPDPRADPDAPWWERRRPIGWQPPR